jgi:hypothetical protein
MPEKILKTKRDSEICTALIDRVQIVADTRRDGLPDLPGFDVCRDSFVRPQTSIATYRRARHLKNSKTKTTIDIQYQRVAPWLRAIKMTVIADDHNGLGRPELEEIFTAFKNPRLLTVEMAVDFSAASEIDRAFVLRHTILGRSRPVGGRLYEALRFGTRHSATMARAYEKIETSSYRVEVELHSSWLRKNDLNHPGDLAKLPSLLLPARLHFVRIDWDLLAIYLDRTGRSSAILDTARTHQSSIHKVLAFLRGEGDVTNPHRFLRPLRINKDVKQELENWAQQWRKRSCGTHGGRNV